MNEYTQSIYSTSLFYSSPPVFVVDSDLSTLQGFASLYKVTHETASAIIEAGTAAGFKGPVWSPRLWIDVDTKGLTAEVALEKLKGVEDRLRSMELDYIAYDSGGHGTIGGGHFGVLREAKPSHTLPAQDRAWVKKYFGDVADTSIYTHLHLFRLPGTIHEVTGRTKHVVSQSHGKSLKLPPYQSSGNNIEVAYPAVQTLNNGGSIFSNFSIMSNIGPKKNGERHQALLKLAFELRDHGVGVNQALFLLQENNKLFESPKGQEELEKIVRDVYGKE